MRKIAFHNRYTQLNPLLFTHPDAPIGDELLLPFNRLAQDAARRGIVCCTIDDLREGDDLLAVVFIDRPSGPYALPAPLRSTLSRIGLRPDVPIYLIAFENATILPENWENLGGFAKVFSWARAEELPADRFVHLNYASQFPDEAAARRGPALSAA